jgi:hypothetical protein
MSKKILIYLKDSLFSFKNNIFSLKNIFWGGIFNISENNI